jgi:hypothetical protein
MQKTVITTEAARLVETKYGKKYPIKVKDESGNEETLWVAGDDEVAPNVKANMSLEVTYREKKSPTIKILGQVERKNYDEKTMVGDVQSLTKVWIEIYDALSNHIKDAKQEEIMSGVNTIFIQTTKKH